MNRRFARRILALLCAIIFAWTSSKTVHAEAGVTAAYAQAEYDQTCVSMDATDTTDISTQKETAQEEALQEDSGMQPMKVWMNPRLQSVMAQMVRLHLWSRERAGHPAVISTVIII